MSEPFTAPEQASSPEQSRWFSEEIQPHEPALRAYLCRRFPMLRDVDDLIQESYARLMTARKAGKVANAKAYLFAMGRNAGFDFYRRRQIASIDSIAEIERLAVSDESRDGAEAAEHDQEIEILAEAIRALPQRCREVVILRKLHGLSHREIAGRLGISRHTVNAHLTVAIVRCRKYLRARGVVRGPSP